jgi:nucleotide sugar dehydrogenase
MKIGVIGLGYVGSAVAHTHRNDDIIIRDPKLGDKSSSIEEIKKCEAVYVCVPTPMSDDGHCDDSYVRSVLTELSDYTNVIICKSTVPPGIYKELHDQYPNLVHAPEFLTAANAVQDYETSSWVLIGGSKEYTVKAEKIIRSSTIAATHYHHADIATASLFKYLANCLMATKVTFMNDFYQLAKLVDIDWEEIKQIAKNDDRLGTTHWDVPGPDGKFGYGGACFPKDVSAIVKHGEDINAPQKLLSAVNEINHSNRSR